MSTFPCKCVRVCVCVSFIHSFIPFTEESHHFIFHPFLNFSYGPGGICSNKCILFGLFLFIHFSEGSELANYLYLFTFFSITSEQVLLWATFSLDQGLSAKPYIPFRLYRLPATLLKTMLTIWQQLLCFFSLYYNTSRYFHSQGIKNATECTSFIHMFYQVDNRNVNDETAHFRLLQEVSQR